MLVNVRNVANEEFDYIVVGGSKQSFAVELFLTSSQVVVYETTMLLARSPLTCSTDRRFTFGRSLE